MLTEQRPRRPWALRIQVVARLLHRDHQLRTMERAYRLERRDRLQLRHGRERKTEWLRRPERGKPERDTREGRNHHDSKRKFVVHAKPLA